MGAIQTSNYSIYLQKSEALTPGTENLTIFDSTFSNLQISYIPLTKIYAFS